MKFYDRDNEQQALQTVLTQSRQEARMTVIMGRRRIGKTELSLHCGDDTMLYFFVGRKTEAMLCEEYTQEMTEKLGIPVLGTPRHFADIFKFVLQTAKTRPLTLIIDEFQNFLRVNPTVFSDMQRDWDLNRHDSRLNLIISGSAFTLMQKIFEDYNEPLFGRANQKIMLQPFTTATMKQILADYNPHYTHEDLLALFVITGGIPWYMALMLDNGKCSKGQMLKALTEGNSPFIDEGKNILIEEFGPDYANYFSILTSIATGMRTRTDIETQNNLENIGGYLARLTDYHKLIKKALPVFAKDNAKKTRYALNDMFLTLWFRFFYKYQALVENNAMPQLARIIERDYDTFAGMALERYFHRKLQETGRYTRIGQFWDRTGKNEIDLIAVNEIDRKAEIYEVKKNPDRFNPQLLDNKVKVLLDNCKEQHGMEITTGRLSMNDM